MSTSSMAYQDAGACPFCKAKLDQHFAADAGPRAMPAPGDLAICAYCAEVMLFNWNLRATKPAPNALEQAFAEDPGLARTIRVGQNMIRAKRGLQ